MNALIPIAVTGAPLLRAIQGGEWAGLSELAILAERKTNNIVRDLSRLEEAGLVSLEVKTRPVLTAAGIEQLAAIGRANVVQPLFDEIEADPFNPRQDFDPEFIQGLAESIWAEGKRDGLLQRIVIRRREGGDRPYRLIAGENRLRAIGLLIADGRWPRDLPPPTEIREMTDEQAEVYALIENVQRLNLNAIDEANRYRHFRDVRGWSTAKIAETANRSQKHVQNLLRCLELPSDVQELMRLPKSDERHIGAREARRLFQQKTEPQVPRLELEPILALALAELAHKVQEQPTSEVSEPGFTRISGWPTVGALAELNVRKVVTFKTAGDKTFAKILAHSSGALAWLEGQNFYVDPQAVIDHWAAQAFSPEVREKHAQLVAQYPDQPGYYTRILIMSAEIYGAYSADGTHTPPPSSHNEDGSEANPVRQGNPAAPPKTPLTTAEILVLAEIAALADPDMDHHRSAYDEVDVRPSVEDLPIVGDLLERRLLKLVTPSRWGSVRFQMSLGYDGWRALGEHLPQYIHGKTAEERTTALNGAWDQSRAAGDGPDTIVTDLRAFFEGEIEVPPEGQVFVDQIEAEERAKREREEEQAALKASQEEKFRREQERGKAFLVAIRAFEAAAEDMNHDQFATAFGLMLADHHLEGPFSVVLYNKLPALADADGEPLTACAPELFECLRRIQAIALNHAIGRLAVYSGDELPDPNARVQAEHDTTDWEPETEEEFWRLAGETFSNRYGVSEARAAELLQLAMARLDEQGVSYGDDTSEWGRLDAEYVATGYVEDFPDCIEPQASPSEVDE